MIRIRAFVALPLLLVAACDEPARLERAPGSTTPTYERVESGVSPLESATRPVRIGELGASFAACGSRGTTRRAEAGLAVRAAPFEAAQTLSTLPAGATFFVCSRSLDQKWFGIIFDESGTAVPECDVSTPIPSARTYAGPCRSGWVASAAVKLSGA